MFVRIAGGRQRWDGGRSIARHRHGMAYAAVVLSGAYEERGSRGRFRVAPGDVLLHGAFEAHLDRFGRRGAEILNLALPSRAAPGCGRARLGDADMVVRAAESDPAWRLDGWAQRRGFAAETLSHGFARVFGLAPARFRAEIRTRRAFEAIATGDAPRFRLKPIAIVVTVLLGLGLPFSAAYCAVSVARLLHFPLTPGFNLRWLYVQHGFQSGLALVAIAILKAWPIPPDYGLHWPRGKTYIGAAILWGTVFAVVMTAVDNVPQIIAHARPQNPGFPLSPANVRGWTLFEGVYVGPTEEIPLRQWPLALLPRPPTH